VTFLSRITLLRYDTIRYDRRV